jgi:HEAT repeat protein
MKLSPAKMAIAVQSETQEVRVLSYLKILHLRPEWVLDPSEMPELIFTVGEQILEETDAIFGLGVLTYTHLLKQVSSGGSHDESVRQSSLNLLRSKSDQNPSIIKALLNLAQNLRSQDLILATQYLSHKNPKVRLATLGSFHRYASQQDQVSLLGLLGDPDLRVRFYSRQILSPYGHDKILKILESAINSSTDQIRYLALKVLAYIKTSEDIVRYLLQGVKEGLPHLKLESIQAMGYHQDEKIRSVLVGLENNLSIEICEAASQALKLHQEGHNRVLVDFDRYEWPFEPLLLAPGEDR